MKTKLIFGLLVVSLILLFQCSEKKDPVSVTTHPDGWTEESSANFHGKAIEDGSLSQESCQTCHGEDYNGGNTDISCFKCHGNYPHPEGFGDRNSENFHTGYIADNSWDIIPCQTCHGADYGGMGSAEKNCLKCHTAPNGPEACNTCHGSADNAAPPVNLMKESSTSIVTIGAHQPHLTGTHLSTFATGTGSCETCHIQPSSYDAPGHIDDSPHAEVIFNSLTTDNGRLNTAWDRVNGSCSDVYCHGAFEFKKDDSQYPWAYTGTEMTGSNPKMFWQYLGTGQALCGSCHGLPPQGHAPVTSCTGCHDSVVDENLNIVNKYLHINGQIDVFN